MLDNACSVGSCSVPVFHKPEWEIVQIYIYCLCLYAKETVSDLTKHKITITFSMWKGNRILNIRIM